MNLLTNHCHQEWRNRGVLYTYGNGLIAQEKTGNLRAADTEVPGAVQNEHKEYLLYHFNHIGSTTAVTDEVGAIKYTYTYSIYGELLSGNYGEVAFLYNGQYGVTSDDNGLYYMRARYYNIDIKRFINQDILTGSIDSSQSLNRYAYVEGNPVNFLDPFGLEKMSDDTIKKIMGYVQIAAQTLSVVFFISGQKFVSDVFSFIADIAACTAIALNIRDAYYATTVEEQNKALYEASWQATCLIFSKILGKLGEHSALSTVDVNQEIEQKVMDVSTRLVDFAFSLLCAACGG